MAKKSLDQIAAEASLTPRKKSLDAIANESVADETVKKKDGTSVDTASKFSLFEEKGYMQPLTTETGEPTEYTQKIAKEKQDAAELELIMKTGPADLEPEGLQKNIYTKYMTTLGYKTPDEMESVYNEGIKKGLPAKVAAEAAGYEYSERQTGGKLVQERKYPKEYEQKHLEALSFATENQKKEAQTLIEKNKK
jgi:hypothetical protein